VSTRCQTIPPFEGPLPEDLTDLSLEELLVEASRAQPIIHQALRAAALGHRGEAAAQRGAT
jgi:hypothetical protein